MKLHIILKILDCRKLFKCYNGNGKILFHRLTCILLEEERNSTLIEGVIRKEKYYYVRFITGHTLSVGDVSVGGTSERLLDTRT